MLNITATLQTNYRTRLSGLTVAALLQSGPVQQQSDQARLIAESATTSILLQKAVEQEYDISKKEKLINDLKAALLLMCGVLKRTSYANANVSVQQLYWLLKWMQYTQGFVTQHTACNPP